MKKIYLIGIGTGNPEHLTIQAINTFKKVNVFFILEKESEKNEDLVNLRKGILQRYLPDGKYRVITVKIPERKKGGRELEVYKERVASWRKQKAEIISNLIKQEIADGETGAILIWGDPALYDGHIEILNYILKEEWVDFEFEVIPGITSMQVLTARHKIPLNFIGESIRITTGRRLKEIHPNDVKNSVVLLDNYLTYRNFSDTDLHIYWGGYLGTEEEILISGRLNEVLDEIIRTRNEAKKNNGWIMETYILRGQDNNE
ncbi:MAG: precorrin-6A synthase (deacetylating) [Nitrospirae bacterium]|nr:precorrin-6A synthase (deacetylating) [Nitrospirota bacterium]MCL5978761.1 precorrin-6A synthase (deacetylating) [Nitrospirota bacterium]